MLIILNALSAALIRSGMELLTWSHSPTFGETYSSFPFHLGSGILARVNTFNISIKGQKGQLFLNLFFLSPGLE